VLHFEWNDSGVLAQYSKDLPFDCETLNGCRSKTAPQSLSISRVYSILFLRHNGKLEDGCVVEEGNIVVRAGGDKGGAVDSPWVLRLKLVRVHPHRSSRLAEREDGYGLENGGLLKLVPDDLEMLYGDGDGSGHRCARMFTRWRRACAKLTSHKFTQKRKMPTAALE
jgi:hypothetical protein